jgi:transglutaminase-like putative cysteine protease
VLNGPIFPPGLKNDHVWAELYLPQYGWLPVDVTYSEVAGMAPGLTGAERRTIRDFFFGRMDRWRFCCSWTWTRRRKPCSTDVIFFSAPRPDPRPWPLAAIRKSA